MPSFPCWSRCVLATDQLRELLTVEPDTPLEDAARLLRRERIGALPVVSAGRVVGIVTRSDLLEALAELLAEEAADRPRPGSRTEDPR